MNSPSKLQLDKLVNLVNSHTHSDAQCPACALHGQDKKGQHLRIWPDGAFCCVVDDSKEHNKIIFDLVGAESTELGQTYIAVQPRMTVKASWPVDVLGGLVKNYDYWNRRGISSDTCEKFQIGVAHKGYLYGRSVIPIFNDRRDRLVGFTGRALFESEMKYKHKGEKTVWLWPHIPPESDGDTVILLESPACAMYLWDNGIKSTKVLFGLKCSKVLIAYLLRRNPKKILISTNNEASGIGNDAAIRIRRQLLQFFPEESVIEALPPAKDFAELIKDSDGKSKLDLWCAKYL